MTELDGRIAIVTGAAGGLGLVYGRALAQEGASVTIADIDGEAAARAAAGLAEAGHAAIGVQVDVADDGAVHRMVEATRSAFGGVNVLVNNAGWRPNPSGDHYDFAPEATADLPGDAWRRVLAVNVAAPLVCAQACRPLIARTRGRHHHQPVVERRVRLPGHPLRRLQACAERADGVDGRRVCRRWDPCQRDRPGIDDRATLRGAPPGDPPAPAGTPAGHAGGPDRRAAVPVHRALELHHRRDVARRRRTVRPGMSTTGIT